MNVYDLKDRVAIVTGGAQGIGLAVADRMLASGAHGLRSGTATARCSTRRSSASHKPDRVHSWVIDIADLAAVEAGDQGHLDHFGKIDILINNAAIVGPNAPTWEYPPEAFRDVVNVGLIGTFYCCRAVVPHMIAANYGRIVNLASIAGKEGNPRAPAYSSMKAGRDRADQIARQGTCELQYLRQLRDAGGRQDDAMAHEPGRRISWP